MFSLGSAVSSHSAFDLLLWAFILAGIALRLWRLDAMEFKEDELTHMLGAFKAAADPWSAPLLAGEGTNPSPGVFFYQFLAVPAFVTRDPVSVAGFIALVNVVTIPGLFLLVRRLTTPQVALWTTALFATSPWMIVFSRKIWNPDLIVPFLIITFWCLFSAMQRYATWKMVAFASSLALLSQLHLSVWLALFPLLPLGLLFRPWRKPLDIAAGAATFLATIFLTLGTRAGEFFARFSGASAQPSDLGMGLPQLVEYNAAWSVRVPSGFGFGFLLGGEGYASFTENPAVEWARPVFLLYVVLAAAGVVYALHRLMRARGRSSLDLSDRFVLTLLLMACSVHVLYLAFRVAAHPHYHVILSLLPPVLIALFLAWMVNRFRKVGAVVARTFLAIVLAANVAFAFSFLAFVQTHPQTIDGNYGRPYFLDRARWERELGRASKIEGLDMKGSPSRAASREAGTDPRL